MKKYIEFQFIERKPKTFVYSVRHVIHGNELGRILWYGAWRQYIFEPGQNTVWSQDCLKYVQDFLTSINNNQKEKRCL